MDKVKIMLFTSPTCPNCPPAKEILTKLSKKRDDISVTVYSTMTREGQKKAMKHNVMAVPTTIFSGPGHDGFIGLVGAQTEQTLEKYIEAAKGNIELKQKSFWESVKEVFS